MIGIICKLENDATQCVPILDEGGDAMAAFKTLKEAEDFADSNPLCIASEVVYIDLDDFEIVE